MVPIMLSYPRNLGLLLYPTLSLLALLLLLTTIMASYKGSEDECEVKGKSEPPKKQGVSSRQCIPIHSLVQS